MRGGFGAEAVDNAYGEDGALVVAEGEGIGPGEGWVGEEAEAPPGVTRAGDEEGDAAAADVGVTGTREVVAMAPEGGEDVDGEGDEGGAHKAFADGIEVLGEGEVEEDDGDAEDGDGEGVAEGVEQAEAHAFAPAALDAGDVGDGGEMVVVEAVAEAQQEAGKESELESG